MGVPVIGIGVPTVIDLRKFHCNDSLSQDSSPWYVSPREIDEITELGAKIIGDAINQAFGFF